jgi:hypothetical protein
MCLEITLNASPIINVITVVTACPTECICLSQTQVSSQKKLLVLFLSRRSTLRVIIISALSAPLSEKSGQESLLIRMIKRKPREGKKF